MILNRVDRWAYIGINKNGSTSLHDYLQQPPFCGTDVDPEERHLTPYPEGCEQFKTLVIVREPFSRALSLWQHASWNEMPGISFPDFLQAIRHSELPFYSYRQSDFIRNVKTPVIVQLEDLEAGLKRFFNLTKIPNIPRLNVTNSYEWDRIYTPELFNQVIEIYREDFHALGYFES